MRPCIFLHGFLGAPDEWDPLIDALDLPEPKRAMRLPLATHWSAGIDRLAEQLPDTCVLIGYSLGARVALGVTMAYPDRVRGLCLISGNPGLDAHDRPKRLAHDDQVARQLLTRPLRPFLDEWYRQDVFASVDPTTRAAWVDAKETLDRPYQAKLLRCYSVAGQPDFRPQLASITVPVAIVVGEDDAKYVAIGRAMKTDAPKLQFHVVPSAGHAVHRERPTALQSILQVFIASLPR